MNHSLTLGQLITRLCHTGWLSAGESFTEVVLEAAIRRYQQWHGLDVDGWAGPQTARSLLEPRFCAHPDHMAESLDLQRWVDGKIRWTITGQLPHLAPEDQRAAFAVAWLMWAEVCGVTPAFVTDAASADVLIGVGEIDGPGKLLAWSEMPDANHPHGKPLKSIYDTAETWGIGSPPAHRWEIDLVRVAGHELGHCLGLPHLPGNNLMAPMYSLTIQRPQPGDITEAVSRYGAKG